MTSEYHQKLDEHSSAHRHDPLRDAVRHLLATWDQEGVEREELSEEMWVAVRELRTVLEEVQR